MNKIRLSYTLLATWDRGFADDTVRTYFHMDRPTTPAMERGKKVHEDIAEYITKHNAFPEWFFTYDLKIPEPEKEMVVSYNELFDLKGFYDCYDSGTETLFEFKTGNTDALKWARTWQLPIYFLIGEIAKVPIKKAFIIRTNMVESEFVIVHNTETKRAMARNIIDSLGPEIYNYFEQNGLV